MYRGGGGGGPPVWEIFLKKKQFSFSASLIGFISDHWGSASNHFLQRPFWQVVTNNKPTTGLSCLLLTSRQTFAMSVTNMMIRFQILTWYIFPSTSMLTALVHSSKRAHWEHGMIICFSMKKDVVNNRELTSLKEPTVQNFAIITCRQTWDLSKNLHNRIFGPKILHTESDKSQLCLQVLN